MARPSGFKVLKSKGERPAAKSSTVTISRQGDIRFGAIIRDALGIVKDEKQWMVLVLTVVNKNRQQMLLEFHETTPNLKGHADYDNMLTYSHDKFGISAASKIKNSEVEQLTDMVDAENSDNAVRYHWQELVTVKEAYGESDSKGKKRKRVVKNEDGTDKTEAMDRDGWYIPSDGKLLTSIEFEPKATDKDEMYVTIDLAAGIKKTEDLRKKNTSKHRVGPKVPVDNDMIEWNEDKMDFV